MKPGDKTLYRIVGSLMLVVALWGLVNFVQQSQTFYVMQFLVSGFAGVLFWYRSLKPASDKAKGQPLNRGTRRRLEEGLQADEKPKRKE